MTEAQVTILVVDDEIDVLEMIELGLQSGGYQLLLADNGERAIQLFERHRVDLVICDIKMPSMNGITVVTRLRERDPALPVVLLTGYIAPETARRCAQLGGVELVRKPFPFHELSQAVRAGLQRRAKSSPPGDH
jgi:CheY-like chemotaxis protein